MKEVKLAIFHKEYNRGVNLMNRILILTDIYFPKPLANGICIHQLSLALKDMGYEVHVLCFNTDNELQTDKYEDIYIHRVKARLFFRLRSYGEANINKLNGKFSYKIAMLMNKFKKLLFLPFYPITSPLFIRRNSKYAEKLYQKYNFDIVISAYNPIESCISGLFLKKKYDNLTWVLYVLDSLTNGVNNRFLSKRSVDCKGWKWEKKFYEHADKILNIKCHENHHMQERYDKYRYKMDTVDIPLFKKHSININNLNNPYDKKCIHFVYAGALSSGLRNPRYLCEVFIKLNEYNTFNLHFYSRGDVEYILEEYQNRTNGAIVRHGYVKHGESLDAIYGADVLISIGNENSEMIPSKTFEYISTGKKIIHFYKSESDSSICYYEKYPLALLINENDSIEFNSNKIMEFLNEPHKEIDFEEISKIFIANTPEYSANIIVNAEKLNFRIRR